jgi:hypothetical protein
VTLRIACSGDPFPALDQLVAELGMGSPSAWWPKDQSWFVATDYDLPFPLVGGPHALTQRLLDATDLECIPVQEANHATS